MCGADLQITLLLFPDMCRCRIVPAPAQTFIENVDGEKKMRAIHKNFLFEDNRSRSENSNQQQQQQQAAMESGQEFDQEPIENNKTGRKSNPNQDFVVERRSIDGKIQSNEEDANQNLLNGIRNETDTSDTNAISNLEECPEYVCAIKFVTAMKARFADDPASFKAFLEIIESPDGKRKPLDEVLIQVSIFLFK